jgi:hypothetical protein
MPTPTRADGMGSVVLDVVPAHVRVDDVYDINPHKVQVVTDIKIEKGHPYDTIITTYETQEVTDRQLVPLCEAPCALTLPTGTHHLHLQSIDDGRWSMLDVDVTAAPQTIRVGLGCVFRPDPGTSSDVTWARVPEPPGHRFRSTRAPVPEDLGTDSGGVGHPRRRR